MMAVLALGLAAWGAPAQEEDAAAGKSFTFHRKVEFSQRATPPAIVVSEFFTHGELQADGANLAVFDGKHELVPWRVLQVGPGDLCRVAFQTEAKQHQYRISYGGKTPAPKAPAWTATAGLLLETRHWKGCNLQDVNSVRNTFQTATAIGSDYVPSVYQRFNPIAPTPGPFLSIYRGTLRAPTAGKYVFFTTSQDASFLSIDDKVVAAAPGRHGPVADARHKGEVTLTVGAHKFEYVHAAAGEDACMVAAWQPPRGSKPELIPPGAFGSEEVAHLPAVGPFNASDRPLRDFVYDIVDEVPMIDNPPLIRVQFRGTSARSTSAVVRLRWDFGDGQTSNQAEPTHIYLHPGLYTVKVVPAESAGLGVANRVQVDRPLVLPDPKRSPDQLAAYLKVFDTYDPMKLDPPGVLQLVRAYEQGNQSPKGAKVGKAWLLAEPPPKDQDAINTLVHLVGPMLRDRVDDPEGALAVWQAAAKAVSRANWKAEYLVEAADVALNDLLQTDPVEAILKAADAAQARAKDPAVAARLNRVWGDFSARRGDQPKALEAYNKALSQQGKGRSTVEQDAWRGAHSRSTEAFLRDKELDRALAELRTWQEEYPADRIEGYLPLLQARYWVARGKYANAIALANDLVAVNPDSPYADRLVFLAAECEEKQGQVERARAGYKTLVTDYPGSPLVSDANKRMAELAAKAEKK